MKTDTHGGPAEPAETREPFEAIAKRKGTEQWVVNCMAAYHRWAKGREITATEFDAAEKAVMAVELTSPAPVSKK